MNKTVTDNCIQSEQGTYLQLYTKGTRHLLTLVYKVNSVRDIKHWGGCYANPMPMNGANIQLLTYVEVDMECY